LFRLANTLANETFVANITIAITTASGIILVNNEADGADGTRKLWRTKKITNQYTKMG